MTKVEAEQEFTELPENEKLNWLNATVWTKEQLSQRPDLFDSGFEYRYVNYLTLGNPCSSTMCLTDYVHQVKERLSRWNEGLYTGLEAVKILTESNPAINPSSLKKQIIEAVESCSLVVRENGIPVNVKPGDGLARALVMPIRIVDINAWLKNNQAGYVLVHPYDAAVAHHALTFTHTTQETQAAPEQPADAVPAPVRELVKPETVTHTLKTPRRDVLTPVIERAQRRCHNSKDSAEVWANLLVLAEKKSAPLFGATDEGLQYLKGGDAAIFTRDALSKRLAR